MKVLPYDVRAVSGVNQNLVVSVSLPLHLLGAVGSWRLRFAVDKEKGEKKIIVQNRRRKDFLMEKMATCPRWEG